MPKKIAKPLHPWAQKPIDLFHEFKSREKGLSSFDAHKRLKQYGLNEVAKNGKTSAWLILFKQFTNPLVFVLIFASVIAFFLGEKSDAIIILVIVVVNSVLGFMQEYRAAKTVDALRKLVSQKATVMRDGEKKKIDAKCVAMGDIVYLEIGDIVPADIRLLEQDDMSIDEAPLTGESVPVVKTIDAIPESKTLPQYLKNIAFMGTHVMSGRAHGIVIATGERTFFGKTASYLKEPETVSDFEKSIGHFSKFLLKIIMAMTLVIFIVNAAIHQNVFAALLFALALAVGITPEALPVIITLSLSKGAQILAKSKVIVKKLSSIEDLGNMDILCTDKTGTLTEGHLTLQNCINASNQEDPQILVYGMLCNEAIICKHKVEGNIIDRAILESKQTQKVMKHYKEYKVLDHNEFDFSRRRMSVVAEGKDGKRYLVVKGALESLEKICDHILLNGKKEKLTHEHLKKYLAQIDDFRIKGYSTISLALKEWHPERSTKEDETNLTLIGFLTFIDPPRVSTKTSLEQMKQLGVKIKVLSGDDPLVTESICKKVGLIIEGGKIYTGDELDKLNEKEFKEVVEKYNVFARIAPAHKYNIVKTLNTGEERTVAFMGDGINDAPAIKAADVGISVNTATDIAKEAADIILLDKDLQIIVTGIMQGRKIFTNITKYILNTISANYGNMFTVAASSMFLSFIPLLPSQILLNNLLTDSPMLAIASDSVDPEMLKKPKKLDMKMIRSFMNFFGFLSTVFDLTMILALLFLFKTDVAVFRTAWFLESAISELLVTFALRTVKPFYKSMPGKLLLCLSVLTVIVIFVLIYSPLGSLFDFAALNSTLLLFIIGVIVLYFTAAEISKRIFFKKFNF